MKLRSLTGIKPTGMPHIGNWLGAIRPALELSKDYEPLYFIADYHALTTTPAPEDFNESIYTVGATWLALGLDPENCIFYRQSHVPEITQLSWLLSCFAPKGFMNRAHGYKDRMTKNQEAGKDLDDGVNMGFYSYPVLMAADILLFSANVVPIGQDQKQHLEFARDFADRINNHYGKPLLVLPEAKISEHAETIVGLDGRKMSKSYGNTIPLFLQPKPLQKLINKIVTNSQTPEEPKNPEESYVYSLHRLFLNGQQDAEVRKTYEAGGMGWGQAKKMFFESLNAQLEKPREEFFKLMDNKDYLDEVLKKGAEKARAIAGPYMENLKREMGF